MHADVSIDKTVPTPPHAGGLLDCAQAAQYLNLSESYVRKAVASNRIPFVRIGSRTLFRRSDLDEWVNAHLVSTNDSLNSKAEVIAANLRVRKPKPRWGKA